jgi:cold-inducible RNA-binding protein
MESKLYVGNLPYNTSEGDLQTMFGQAGIVKSVQIIKDRDTGRSKGFGFIEMSSQEEAQKAISMFNGKEMDGRALTVNIARPKEERGPGGGGGERRSYGGSSGGSGNYDRAGGGGSSDRNRSKTGGNRGGGRSSW